MILQALKEYYDRKAADPESGIAPYGWEKKGIPFLFVIDKEAELVQIEDTREEKDKKLIARNYLVPQSVKRSSGILPNLLWDNIEYVFGIPSAKRDLKKAGEKILARVKEEHSQFLEKLEPYRQIPSVSVLLSFLQRSDLQEIISKRPEWEEISKSDAFVSFRLAGDEEPIFRDKEFCTLFEKNMSEGGQDDQEKMGRCLVTGKRDVILPLHPAIKGVYDANSTGANIISFNFDAAGSFGKKQGANSPVGKGAVFAYTTALNTLLAKDSRQKLGIGDATVVFWSSRPTELEGDLLGFLGVEDGDNPDALTENVSMLFQSVQSGKYAEDEGQTRFYVLGLSPSAARLSVRFWYQGTVGEMAGRFRDWFEDLRIVHGEKLPEHLPLKKLLVSLAAENKYENIPPNLAGNVVRAILAGVALPETLLLSALVRIKATQGKVTYERAKLIKAFMNRKIRSSHFKTKEIGIMLDKENENIGYRLGRLFAVLEKIQKEAMPGINATIRDRFYASASATPAVVFGTLMRLKNYHLAKLDKEGFKIYYEGLIGEILYRSQTQPGVSQFPAHLSLVDQGMFALGFYHQQQDFYAKKSVSTEE
ncbi:MAG: type I-C CRISPR-associated protein Cas8c/Csd1 [Oligosphaeraceae bacterium]